MNKISIICPAFNAEDFIGNAIESIINQSFSDWELILINDGSTDKTLSICNYYCVRDKRIKVFTINNSGAYIARIIGLKNSSSKYVTFLDSDDYLDKQALEIVIEKINKYFCDILVFNMIAFDSTGTLKEKKPSQIITDEFINDHANILKKTFVDNNLGFGVCGCCFKKDLFNLNPETNVGRYGEDMLFAFNAFKNAKNLLLISNKLYYYRMNKQSVTHNLVSNDYFKKFIVFDKIYSSLIVELPRLFQDWNFGKFIYNGYVNYLIHHPKENITLYIKNAKKIRNCYFYKKCLINYRPKGKKNIIIKKLLDLRLYILLYFLG